MNKKWTYELLQDYLNNLGYELINKNSTNIKDKIVIKDRNGYYYDVHFHNLIRCDKLLKFTINNIFTICNINHFINITNIPVVLLSKKFLGAGINLEFKCLICNEIFNMTWSNFYAGQRCSYCANHKIGKSNCLAFTHPHLIEEWDYNKNKTCSPFSVVAGSHINIWWKCKVCGHFWKTNINNRSRVKSSGCPKCKVSEGERCIELFLKENRIKFKKEYSFDNLTGLKGKPLRFDFAIFKNQKLTILIEYDGEFHFRKMYKNQPFLTLQEHDKRKNQYCKDYNISLLRIPYWEFDNIEQILQRELT